MKPSQLAGQQTVRVWGVVVRLLHWSLVVTVVASWWTRYGFGRVHEWWGYAAAGVVTLRVLWGFIGPEHARFARFVKSPANTRAYFREVLKNQADRHIHHNPLGAWMVVALLVTVSAVCFSGWLYTTDRFWGLEWVENLHDGLTWCLILLLCGHLSGVLWGSLRDKENLVSAMIHGRKRK